ncbi:hypothetical protein [Peredibacter starrii]|uniref:Radical SAM protein n=1 Tax=Peredibacter starrii TaxID=28202 RepID=A0AAX4HQM5_9BACT|nr:hypothetical protein [Peredibacter starrii]WPU65629.1 hypothetical protein SOO65_02595 [Peredibacter starrii]
MDTLGYLKTVLGNKKPRVAEIELTLFENCDVNCTFCAHEKSSVIGMKTEEMLSKIPLIENFLDEIDSDVEMVNLHLVGGELLQDRLIDGVDDFLARYELLISEYQRICERRQIEPRIILVSNMLTTKSDVVIKWLEKLNETVFVRLIASFDPFGRPLTKQYFLNLKIFRQFISNINVVVTKEAIRELKKGNEQFDRLYQEFPIFMDDFLPDVETSRMIPSDEEYLEYLELVVKKYPKLLPFGEAISKVLTQSPNEIQFTTFNKCNILPNNKVTNYLWERHPPESFVTEVNYQDNSNMLYRFIEENQCLSCEYYQSCPLRCPVSWSWKDRVRSKGCVNKRFFDSLAK